MKKNQVSQENRLQYAGIYLIEYMVNTPAEFAVFLDANDADLEPILEWLLTQGLVEIHNQEKYRATTKGRDLLKRYMKRYSTYLHTFDVFAHVDLGTGEFAFQSWSEYQGGPGWETLKLEDRWEDLRIAVADYLELDPVEIVFMSYINERRFGRNDSGWQFDLLLGSVWDEITEICDTAIQWQQLGYSDGQGKVKAEQAMEDIVWQGLEVVDQLTENRTIPRILTPSAGQGAERVEVDSHFANISENFQETLQSLRKPWFTF